MANCCTREGVWKFCPWCGAAWVIPAEQERRERMKLPEIARMRIQGVPWGAIGRAFGYTSGGPIKTFAWQRYLRWKGLNHISDDGPWDYEERFTRWLTAQGRDG